MVSMFKMYTFLNSLILNYFRDYKNHSDYEQPVHRAVIYVAVNVICMQSILMYPCPEITNVPRDVEFRFLGTLAFFENK